MIKDIELLENIEPLIKKKVIVWGAGANGIMLLEQLKRAEILTEKVLLCDSDEHRWGEKCGEWEIMSPEIISSIVNEKEYLIVISPIALEIQEDILKQISKMKKENIDCYTEWGVKWGIYLNRKTSKVSELYFELFDNGYGVRTLEGMQIRRFRKVATWMTFAPIHEERIIVYQPGKVGSSSLYKSLCDAQKYTLHIHCLSLWYEAERMKRLCEKWGGIKIISIVRDPLARNMSGMWENIDETWRYKEGVDFMEVQSYYWQKGFELKEFEWFDEELKTVFGIDIYEHPFDKEKGYTIIEQSGVEVLLMTLEKMDELENVIGEFVNIKDFKLVRANEGNRKRYRFAYSDYKRKIRFTERLLEKVYVSNPYMKHFYTDEMIKSFMDKWADKLMEKIPEGEKKFLIDYEQEK